MRHGLGTGNANQSSRFAARHRHDSARQTAACTPRVNGAAGRDHWTYCYSVVLAGAGIRGGTVCGASDAHAAYVKDRPVRPADLCATIYHCLGIDPEMLVADRAGRPVPIAHGGEPIREILA